MGPNGTEAPTGIPLVDKVPQIIGAFTFKWDQFKVHCKRFVDIELGFINAVIVYIKLVGELSRYSEGLTHVHCKMFRLVFACFIELAFYLKTEPAAF